MPLDLWPDSGWFDQRDILFALVMVLPFDPVHHWLINQGRPRSAMAAVARLANR